VRALIAGPLVALALALAACGGPPSASDQVRDVVTRFGQASARKDYQAICDDLIARSLSDNVEEYGLPCELAFKQGLQGVRRPQLRIESIRVKGTLARVRVHSSAANQPASEDVLELRREPGAGWRITSLATPVGARP
jgi:hypothetical protein